MFNITFLNTAFLAGLLAALLPILIHIFNKRKVEKIEFSTIRFLKLSHKKRIRRIKLKQIILLIIRTLIILTLVLALARPALKGVFIQSVSAHANTTVAIVLDNSFSMNYLREDGALFGIAKQKALEIVNLFKEGDDALFALMSDSPDLIFDEPTYNFDILREEIQQAEISEKTTDVMASLQKTYEILNESKNLNKELYLITDLQKIGWKNLEEYKVLSEKYPNIRLYLLPIQSQIIENTCIEKVDYSNQLIQVGEPVLFRIQARNFGNDDVSDRLLQLYVNNRRMAQAGISVEAGKSNSTVLSVTFPKEGTYSGYVELAEDLLYTDNRRYFTINLNSNPRVLIVDGEKGKTSAANFIEFALNPPGTNQNLVTPFLIGQEQLAKQNLEEYQTVILSNVDRLNFGELAKIESFVNNGGGLLTLLGDKIDVKYYNETLFPRFMSMKLLNTIGTLKEEDEKTFVSWGKIDYEHPIFQIFRDQKNGDLSQAHFYVSYEAKSDLGINSLVNFTNDSPAVVEGKRGDGRVIVFNSLPDLEWSNLPVRGFFVPIIHRTVQYLSGNSVGENPGFLVGSDITKQLDKLPYGQVAKVIKPDSSEFFLEPITTEKNLLLKINETKQAGIYNLYMGEKKIDSYPVNVDTKEGDLTKIGTDEVKNTLKDVVIIGENADLADAILKSRYGRELWKEFLAAVLVLMFLEMLIARDKKDEIEHEQ